MCIEKIVREAIRGGMLYGGLYPNGEQKGSSAMDQLAGDIHKLAGEMTSLTKQLATLTGMPSSESEETEEEPQVTRIWSLKLPGIKKNDIEIEKSGLLENEQSYPCLRIRAKKKGKVVVKKVLWIDDKDEKKKEKITATFKEAPEGDEVLRITLEEKKEEPEGIKIE